jgi:transcriptional regulator with GAF, ATPase, and Fis domain
MPGNVPGSSTTARGQRFTSATMPRRIDNTQENRLVLAEALIRHNYDTAAAAREFGISRRAFAERLERLAERPRRD